MDLHVVPPSSAPHRVVGMRGSFDEKPPTQWRGTLAVGIFAVLLAQALVFACHLLWVAESAAARWIFQ